MAAKPHRFVSVCPQTVETSFMIERHVVFYIGSKVVAAVLNLASVALFTRLAGAAGYGEYLIAFAWAYIVYGWSVQWLPLSFFANFHHEDNERQVATLWQMMAAMLALVWLAVALASLGGWIGWELGVKVTVLVVALAAYDGATLIGRAKLNAGRVSLSFVLRGLLVLAFGMVALIAFKSGLALALAVALAHLVAIAPLMPVLRPGLAAASSPATARQFGLYGWPLLASFGASSLGQNIDRLVLGRQRGNEQVGPYGAAGDLIRQSLVFISEAIAIAYIPQAKAAAAKGDRTAARAFMVQAFRAYCAVTLFGAVILLSFAAELISLILGPQFGRAATDLIPWLALGAALAIFRSYYLGQIIYFTGSSRLELWASIATVIAATVLAVLLVPGWGAAGAAIAMASGQGAACAVFLAAALGSPGGRTVLPLPWRDFLSIGCWAAGGYAVHLAAGHFLTDMALSDLVGAAGICLTLWMAVRIHNIMNFNDIISDFTNAMGRVGFSGDAGAGPVLPAEPARRNDDS